MGQAASKATPPSRHAGAPHLSQEAEASNDAPGQKLSATTGPSCAASTSSRRPVLRDHTKIWNESLLPAHTIWREQWGGGRRRRRCGRR